MNGLYQVLLVAVLAVEVLAIGQGSDVARVLEEHFGILLDASSAHQLTTDS